LRSVCSVGNRRIGKWKCIMPLACKVHLTNTSKAEPQSTLQASYSRISKACSRSHDHVASCLKLHQTKADTRFTTLQLPACSPAGDPPSHLHSLHPLHKTKAISSALLHETVSQQSPQPRSLINPTPLTQRSDSSNPHPCRSPEGPSE
jgi:hypothetical protein